MAGPFTSPSTAVGLPQKARMVEVPTPTTGPGEGVVFVSDGSGGLNVGEPYFVPENNGTPVNILQGTPGPEDLAYTLTIGNFTGGNNIVVSNGDSIRSENSAAAVPGRNLVLAPGSVVDTNPGGLLWGTAYASATRGRAAIDLQFARASATHIVGADSAYSAIVGGKNNRIAATGPVASRQAYMGIFAGQGNAILGRDTFGACIIGGQDNTIDGTRAVPTEVAYVYGSVILGGFNNKIAGYASGATFSSGAYRAFIGGGRDNLIGENGYGSAVFGRNNTVDSRIASPVDGFIVSYCLMAGRNNTITADDTVGGSYHSACFGQNNYIRGIQDAFCFGNGNYIGGPSPSYATCSLAGGRDNTLKAENTIIWGREIIQHTRASESAAFGSGAYLYSHSQLAIGAVDVGGTPGTAQACTYARFVQSTSATAVTVNTVFVAADRTWGFRALVSARQTAGAAGTVGDSATWTITGCIKRTGATTSLVGVPTGTGTPSGFNDAAAATWNVAVTANDASETLLFTLTGEASKTIGWQIAIFTTEVG